MWKKRSLNNGFTKRAKWWDFVASFHPFLPAERLRVEYVIGFFLVNPSPSWSEWVPSVPDARKWNLNTTYAMRTGFKYQLVKYHTVHLSTTAMKQSLQKTEVTFFNSFSCESGVDRWTTRCWARQGKLAATGLALLYGDDAFQSCRIYFSNFVSQIREANLTKTVTEAGGKVGLASESWQEAGVERVCNFPCFPAGRSHVTREIHVTRNVPRLQHPRAFDLPLIFSQLYLSHISGLCALILFEEACWECNVNCCSQLLCARDN